MGRKNKEKKAGKSDLKHRAKVMRSWPRVTIDLHALKDADYPLGLKVGGFAMLFFAQRNLVVSANPPSAQIHLPL